MKELQLQDSKLKSEMPKSLSVIEKAADLLERASKDLNSDPFSQAGRDKLITGSRGILQGTTSMLVAFDESQVTSRLYLYVLRLTQYWSNAENC